ncbi:hypothetical protein GCM10022261_17760 [Brevibacterium daeguense]|uniref:FCP1 homology domain-containing protein n=2 Tax=Brevibacterium daeguense TaxID=909936 RepID=A0ABP8EK26_9MICO
MVHEGGGSTQGRDDRMDFEESARRRARHVTLFLDVDGVLNSFPVTGLRFLRERRRRVRAWHYELHFRPRIIRLLERLAERRQVDIVWLSTWSQRCRSELEPKFGFRNRYPIIPMPDDSYNRFANDPHTWWKAIAVEEWLAENSDARAIWIDDDLAAPVTRDYFSTKYAGRLLLIAPEFSRGLGEEHFEAIRAFSHPRFTPLSTVALRPRALVRLKPATRKPPASTKDSTRNIRERKNE